ncbi:profilin [Salmonella sp. s55004]|uniref:profilin n=1 Tax=Salmonella sp. s55004 TaxID=3159675 RepID=UPI00397FE71B
MSWDSYISVQLVGTGDVKQASILGLDGSVWATSDGFNVSAPEAQAMIAGFDKASDLHAKGVHACGIKYLTLNVTPTTIYCKKGSTGLTIAKTGRAVVIGRYEDNMQPGKCNIAVEKLADYLKEQGY